MTNISLFFIILTLFYTRNLSCMTKEEHKKKVLTILTNCPALARKVKDRIVKCSPDKFTAIRTLQRSTTFTYPSVQVVREEVKEKGEERLGLKEDVIEEVKPGNSFFSPRTQVFMFMGATAACSTVVSSLIAGAVALTIHFTSK